MMQKVVCWGMARRPARKPGSWGAAIVAAGVMAVVCCRRAAVEAGSDFPAAGAARPEALVSPSWVRKAMAYREGGYRSECPAGWRHDRLVVVEAAWVRPGESAAYDRGHVPGAVLINTEDPVCRGRLVGRCAQREGICRAGERVRLPRSMRPASGGRAPG